MYPERGRCCVCRVGSSLLKASSPATVRGRNLRLTAAAEHPLVQAGVLRKITDEATPAIGAIGRGQSADGAYRETRHQCPEKFGVTLRSDATAILQSALSKGGSWGVRGALRVQGSQWWWEKRTIGGIRA
jgi:hypothetical protein